MQYSVFPLLAILSSAMFAFVPNIPAYASHPTVLIYGTIKGPLCEGIGGTIVTEFIDVAHTQTVELCKYGDRYFRTVISYPGFLGEPTGSWTDPQTGKHYEFGYPTWEPKPCDPTESWENSYGNAAYYNIEKAKLKVNANEQQFDVVALAQATICDFRFIQDEKKISFGLRGLSSIGGFLDATIPQELLGGDFKVLIDGNEVQHKIKTTETNSTISIEFGFPGDDIVNRQIDIVGTQVIPEFPVFGMTILAAAVSLVLMVRMFAQPKKFYD